ncbi:MAG: menaquinone biosynthesis protein [Desulfuromonadia bacterium]
MGEGGRPSPGCWWYADQGIVAVLTIGRIDYANCHPVYTEFLREHESSYRFVEGVPSRLNSLLSAGEIDVSPSSSIEYARHADFYHLFPGISISSIGPVNSVILRSSLPIDSLDGKTIALTTDSATSVVLLKILLRKYLRFTNRFVAAPDRSAGKGEAGMLVIGDRALAPSDTEIFPYTYDLGSIWFDRTGLPFVFALWIVHRNAVISRGDEVRICARRFLDSRDRAVTRYPSYRDDYRGTPLEGVDLVTYWKAISYDLTPWHCEGLLRFYADAVEIGELKRVPPLQFISP